LEVNVGKNLYLEASPTTADEVFLQGMEQAPTVGGKPSREIPLNEEPPVALAVELHERAAMASAQGLDVSNLYGVHR
jgi:hypothetical protein